MKFFRSGLIIMLSTFIFGCQTMSQPPIEPVEYVDIERFMGDWYVIANIPSIVEKGAHNAVESYKLNDDGTIATTFTFRDDSFDGEVKTYHPKGFVNDHPSNALWGMQFIWPIKADYRIAYLNEAYTQTIIARNKRDYVWLMARTPEISEEDYSQLVSLIAEMGYDPDKIQRVPQKWPSQ
ncbi:lipocalin family protein [Methylophaga sp.]|uniref:lipocalin family protein n=1 Tax=Methylophaga sp. TaxID=2024840 RepID=UPI003F69AB81